jgi:hypothetical protein
MEPFRVANNQSDNTIVAIGGKNSPADTSAVAERTAEPGLFTYQAVKGLPFTVKHFNLENFYDSKAYPEMREAIEKLDEWVQNKARERGLTDSQSSYQEIVDEILSQIGKSENEKTYNTFERIKAAVDALNRLDDAKLPPVLDYGNLTADEIKATAIK